MQLTRALSFSPLASGSGNEPLKGENEEGPEPLAQDLQKFDFIDC